MIDTHAHLTKDEVWEQIDVILAAAHEAGVAKIVNIGTDRVTSERGLELQKKYPWIFNTAATTPHDAHTEGDEQFPWIAAQARAGKLVALGETGLEYHYFPETKEKQKELLIRYLELALECSLPIVIHCRDAFDDLIEIIDKHYLVDGKPGPGILHCFTGTLKEAQELVKRGWYISFSGIVTFKKSEELRLVAKEIPLDQILIETDTPYLAPMPFRSKSNQPAYIINTAGVIAHEREMELQDFIRATADNATRILKI